jgi:hypothetical protein
MWWYIPVITALYRPRQYPEFEVSLGHCPSETLGQQQQKRIL